eukprot:8633880-Karenia_brevis.AAC.1
MLFADNFWLLASSPLQLAAMTEVWLDLLSEYGWSVPLDETVWFTTGPDTCKEWVVPVRGEKVRRAKQQEGFMVLGTRVTFDNAFSEELEVRFDKAWR